MADKRTQYFKCKKLMESYKNQILSYKEIYRIIQINIASSDFSIKQNIKTMLDTGIIKIDGRGQYEVI